MTGEEFSYHSDLHREFYYGQALRLTKNSEDALDLLQAASLTAIRHLEQFRDGTSIRAWLTTIIRNTYFREYRRLRRRQQLLDGHGSLPDWANRTVTDSGATSSLGFEELMREIERLPAIYRSCFLLHFRGMTYPEISRVLNVPVGTIKSRVFTAREKLRLRVSR